MYPTDTNNKNDLSRFCRYICLCVLIGLPATAYSQQWNFEPVIRLTAEYNDNTQLSPDDLLKIDSSAFIVDANARFVRRTQSSEVRFAPRVRFKTNSEDLIDDTTDAFLDFFATRTLERSTLGLQARYSQEDIGTAEIDDPDFDNPDVNNPVNLDTGRIQIGINRESIIFSPYFSHEWTETVEFRFDADYLDVSYDQNQLNLTDYTDASLATGLSYKISERSTWSLNVFSSDYEAESGTDRSESQSIGAELEFRHQFNPTLEGQVSVGYEDVDSDVTFGGVTFSESNGITVFSAGITKRGDISRVVLDASQAVDPGGTGFLQERTQFRLRYTRQLSPTIFGNFNARIQNTKEVSPDLIVRPDRDYRRLGIGVEWRLSREWALRGDYSFTDQEFDSTAGNASSNEVSVSFVYEPKRRR